MEKNKNIYPCIWFNDNAQEAVAFYKSVFGDVNILTGNPTVIQFEINGTRFMGLNGGDTFQPNAAVSYFVYCGGEHGRIEGLYEKLKAEGAVLMALDKYDWSEKYAWVQDRYGVSWQLDIDPINNPQKIVPALLFNDAKSAKVKDAMAYYTAAFENSSEIVSYPFPGGSGMPDGALLFAQFQLNGFIFNALSGGAARHGFDFTEGNSFVVECDSQEEIDHYWDYFSKEGKENRCGWVQDRYGVWWQVIPSVLGILMDTPEKAHKVSEAFMKMKKMDIETLKRVAGSAARNPG